MLDPPPRIPPGGRAYLAPGGRRREGVITGAGA
jgi:hypothetical protein